MRTHLSLMFVAGVVLSAASATAQAQVQAMRPRATLTPMPASAPVAPGGTVAVQVAVSLPADIHVQAHEPKDPLLIPTVLTVDPPDGIVVERVTYPAPTELTQQGRPDPLLVLGPEFEVTLRMSIAPTAAAGTLVVPAVLRYQACNDRVCFPPARANVQWHVDIGTPIGAEVQRRR